MLKLSAKFLSLDEPKNYDFNDSNWKQIKWTSYKLNVLVGVQSYTFKCVSELSYKSIANLQLKVLQDIFLDLSLNQTNKWEISLKVNSVVLS